MLYFSRLKSYLLVLIVAVIIMFYNEQRKPDRIVPKNNSGSCRGRAFSYEDIMNAYIFFLISAIHFKLALESDFFFKYESGDVAKTTSPHAFPFAHSAC